jgi:type I restriction enzyme M protein
MSAIQSIIKNIQDEMRKDAGLDGDAQRISQLVWMLFLKIFDDREANLELIDPNYVSPIPERFRYRTWAIDDEGITGQELADFIDKELFPTLRTLSVSDADNRGLLIRNIFTDTYNYMKNGTLIRKVFNKINEINFNKRDDRHAFGDLYEKILKDLQNAGNAGEFYTPRPLTKFVVEMTDPKPGDRILDPACGTGGFLVNALEYMRTSVATADDERKLHTNIHGTELKPLPHMLAITNMILHGVEDPSTILRGDMLSRPYTDYGPRDRVDVILANPPFGGTVTDGTELNFPSQYRTRETADLFLVLFVHLLREGGRAGIVLPDGSLFGEGVKSKIREHLLTECNLHTIVRLPPGVFNPYAGVNTNLLFFTKGVPTQAVWYYQMTTPPGMKQYTKGKPITDREFDVVREWWHNRTENDHAWQVPIDDIKAKNWNLDFKNPKGGEVEEELSSKELLERIQNTEHQIQDGISALLR